MSKKTDLAELYKQNPRKACQLALRRTRNIPDRGHEKNRLEAINDLLGGYGTEAITGDWQNGYWCDIVAAYVNFGDTYDLTVMHVRGDFDGARESFIITSWGDWVERNGERYGVQ